jgi:hypothetical protein
MTNAQQIAKSRLMFQLHAADLWNHIRRSWVVWL